jgi:hypothetical protein
MPAQFATVAQEISKQVDQQVQQVLESSDDPRSVAEARILQGDLNWHLAAMPQPPGATTRPELGLARTDEQLLQAAADAYQAAVEERGAPHESIVTARLGLAAIAENRRQFDAAKDQYQKVLDDAATPKPLKDLAAANISRLETLRKPPLLAPPATSPATSPFGATQPATTQSGIPHPSSTQSASQPTPPTASTAPATTPTPSNTPPPSTPQPTAPQKSQPPG